MRRLDNSGFTIAEIITSMVVGVILIIGIAGMVNSIRFTNTRTQNMMVINSLVERKTEELRSITFVALQDGEFEFTEEMPQRIPAPRSATYQISTLDDNVSIKQVEFDITFNDAGSSKTYRYKTYIGELGVGQY